MICTIETYLNNVKGQLACNVNEEYKKNYITYDFSNKQIDDNVEYFKRCLEFGLSPYKSLLFFNDYMEGKPTCVDKKPSYNLVVKNE